MLVLYREDTGQVLCIAAKMERGKESPEVLNPEDFFPEWCLRANFGFTDEDLPLAKVLTVPYSEDLARRYKKYMVVPDGRGVKVVERGGVDAAGV